MSGDHFPKTYFPDRYFPGGFFQKGEESQPPVVAQPPAEKLYARSYGVGMRKRKKKRLSRADLVRIFAVAIDQQRKR